MLKYQFQASVILYEMDYPQLMHIWLELHHPLPEIFCQFPQRIDFKCIGNEATARPPQGMQTEPCA